jgi:hypothetical protein
VQAAVCQNIGPKQIRKRRLLGLLTFQVAVILSVVFIWQNVDDMLRALVFIPYFFAYLGILQSMQKTCVFLAFKGKQNMDQGDEAVAEQQLQRRLFFRSVWIVILAALLASICTYLTLAIHPEIMLWPANAN